MGTVAQARKVGGSEDRNGQPKHEQAAGETVSVAGGGRPVPTYSR